MLRYDSLLFTPQTYASSMRNFIWRSKLVTIRYKKPNICFFLQIFREPSKITSLFVTVWAFPRRSVKQSQTSRQQTNNYRETLSCPLFCQHGSVKWWIWDLWLYGVQLRTGLKKPFVNCLSRWIRNQFSNFERLSLRSQPVTLLVMDNFAMFRLGYGFLHKKKIQLRFRCL